MKKRDFFFRFVSRRCSEPFPATSTADKGIGKVSAHGWGYPEEKKGGGGAGEL